MDPNREFWCLEPPESTRYLSKWRSGDVHLESIPCKEFPGHQRSGRRIDSLSVDLPALNMPDFVWTWYSECLIKDSVRDILLKEEVTGYELKRASTFVNNESVTNPRFWELTVKGWGGVAGAKSGIKLISECLYCGHRVYSCFSNARKLIDYSQWDKSDFFIIWPMPRYIFVTERLRSILQQHRLSGFSLSPSSKLECSGTLTPGRLSYWMPEERAREIGTDLEIV